MTILHKEYPLWTFKMSSMAMNQATLQKFEIHLEQVRRIERII